MYDMLRMLRPQGRIVVFDALMGVVNEPLDSIQLCKFSLKHYIFFQCYNKKYIMH